LVRAGTSISNSVSTTLLPCRFHQLSSTRFVGVDGQAGPARLDVELDAIQPLARRAADGVD